MKSDTLVKNFFHSYAHKFDEIYMDELNKKNLINYIYGKIFRKSMFSRYYFTLDSLNKKNIKSILDVGCGAGRYCHALSSLGKIVHGIDFASEMIDLAKKISNQKKLKKLKFEKVSIEKFVFKKKYDAIICLGFFDYIKNFQFVLDKLTKSKPKIIIASFPKKYHLLTPQRKIRYFLRKCSLYFYEKKKLEIILNSYSNYSYKIFDHGRDFVVKMQIY